MIKLRIIACPHEVEQICGILEATGGVRIVTKSKQYPCRDSKENVRVYLECEYKQQDPTFAIGFCDDSNCDEVEDVCDREE